jgi:hypothetical protein
LALSGGVASADLIQDIVGGTTVGGCTGFCPGTVQWYDPPSTGFVNVDCTAGRITISPAASAMSGYTNGQYIAYRYVLRASNGYSGTSGWSGWTLAPYTRQDQSVLVYTPYTALPKATISAARNLSWSVEVQFARWNGSTSVTSGWVAPEGYSQGGTQRWYANCLT